MLGAPEPCTEEVLTIWKGDLKVMVYICVYMSLCVCIYVVACKKCVIAHIFPFSGYD